MDTTKNIRITPNNYAVLYKLKQGDFFSFVCLNCGKYIVKKLQKKKFIEKYKNCLCYKCLRTLSWNNKSELEKQKIKDKTRKSLEKTLHNKYGNDIQSTLQLPYIKDKIIKTNLYKYGVDNPMKNKKIRNKIIKSFMKNHNNKTIQEYNKTNECKEKIKQTKLNKYGDENYNNAKQISVTKLNYSKEQKQKIKDKTINTNKRKYNSNYVIGSQYFLEKSKNTKLKRYGDENYNNVKKYNKTMLDNYGVKNLGEYNKTEQCKTKITNTCRKKYNHDTYFGSQDCINKTGKTINRKYHIKPGIKLKNDQQMFYLQTQEFADKMAKIGYIDSIGCPKLNYYGIIFDSKWELAVWIYYTDHNIPIIRNPCIFEYKDLYGNLKRYHPDFWIYGIGLVEIKSDHYFKDDGTMYFPYSKLHHDSKELSEEEKIYWDNLYEAKHQCGLQNGVIFLTKKDIKKYINYVELTRFKDFLKLFDMHNPYNPSYNGLNGYIEISKPLIYTPIYYSPINIHNYVSPYDIVNNDKDDYTMCNKKIDPYELGILKYIKI